MWHDQTQEHEFGCFYTMSIHKNHFKKQKYGTESVYETFTFLNFDEIYYCGMTKLRNTNWDVFIQCRHKNQFEKRKYVTKFA